MRSVLRAARWQGDPLLRHYACRRCWKGSHDARGSACPVGEAEGSAGFRYTSPGAGSLDRGTGSAVRVLPKRNDDQGDRVAGAGAEPDRGADQGGVYDLGSFGASLPVWKLHRNHRSSAARERGDGAREIVMSQKNTDRNVFGAALTRRGFVKTGGAMVVGFALVGADGLKNSAQAAATKNSLDPTLPESWIEIHPDNSILIRTGKSDFGQSTTFTAYRQIVAEELSARFEDITTVVMGDTDRTPDGSGAFDFLGSGMPNIRKAAAYTHQALLDLAAQRLGVPKNQVTVKDGIVSGGGKSMSYGDLVKGQQLKLTIPVKGDLTSVMGLTVDGNPPMKPVSQYSVIGKSFKNSV